MDKYDKALDSILNNEKSLANSMIHFNQLENQMEQGINKTSDWLYRKDVQMSGIQSAFDKITKETKF